MENETKIDKIQMLAEMNEEMGKSIDNMVEVKSQQEELLEVVKESKKAEDFKEFIEEVSNQIVTMNGQINLLKIRKNKLEQFLKTINGNVDCETVAVLLLDALGIFEGTR